MKILVAPDSFKGSLSAASFCAIARLALAKLAPEAVVDLCPMADGGEGTTEAVVDALGGLSEGVSVTGPLGQPVRAQVGFSPDRSLAVATMADASGLTLVAAEERDVWRATSFGTGELLAYALDSGARRIMLAIGGSATNDGGAGLLQALGYRLLTGDGKAIERGARGLSSLQRIDASAKHPRLGQVEIAVACDVANPLLGPRGASAVFGPQKGATTAMIGNLDAALAHYADAVESALNGRWRDAAGAGAAGGLGFALLSVLGLPLQPGFDLIASTTGLDRRLRDGGYDWLLTGEGRVDCQSQQGKLLSRIGRLAASHGTRSIALCGALDESQGTVELPGIDHIFSISPGPETLTEAMQRVEVNLAQAVQRVMKLALGLHDKPRERR